MPFHLPPPPDFNILRDDIPVTCYRRKLPHVRQDGATYFATCHLNDSLPTAAIRELTAQRAAFDQQHPPPHNDDALQHRYRQLAITEERWLDAGHGQCPFQHRQNRYMVQRALQYFDVNMAPRDYTGTPRYALGAWVIMPNHLHVLVRPLDPKRHPLEKIMQSWKRFISRELNLAEGKEGSRWFEESYDRIVRDSEHLWKCLQYIGDNGRRAGLSEKQVALGVCPEWIEAGWDFMPVEVRYGGG